MRIHLMFIIVLPCLLCGCCKRHEEKARLKQVEASYIEETKDGLDDPATKDHQKYCPFAH